MIVKKKINERILYAIATLILLAIEVFIALYVNDSFVRPYLGDVLVVIVIYTFIRIIIPKKFRLLPLYILVFSVGVEVLQLLNIVELLGLGNSAFFRVLIGSVFDVKDVVCYTVGCCLLGVYEVWLKNKC